LHTLATELEDETLRQVVEHFIIPEGSARESLMSPFQRELESTKRMYRCIEALIEAADRCFGETLSGKAKHSKVVDWLDEVTYSIFDAIDRGLLSYLVYYTYEAKKNHI
jgi:uncharacterized protein YheU (UPF0270 family)